MLMISCDKEMEHNGSQYVIWTLLSIVSFGTHAGLVLSTGLSVLVIAMRQYCKSVLAYRVAAKLRSVYILHVPCTCQIMVH